MLLLYHFFSEKTMFVTLYVGLLLCGKGGRGIHPPHPRRSLYTPPVDTPAPSAPGRTAHDRQQHRPRQMQGKPPTAGRAPTHTPGRWTRCTGLHLIPNRPRGEIVTAKELECMRSVSDRARPNGQAQCKQKYLFFMVEPLDKRNKIVYNIDSKQRCLHSTTKQEDKNHEKDL